MTKPTLHTLSDGTRIWRLDGKQHRFDGPAVEYADGTRSWWVHGKRHRTDGPAYERSDGYREWWVHGQLHRLDGPALTWPTDQLAYYANGVRITDYVRPYIAQGMSDADAITAALIDLERENAP